MVVPTADPCGSAQACSHAGGQLEANVGRLSFAVQDVAGPRFRLPSCDVRNQPIAITDNSSGRVRGGENDDEITSCPLNSSGASRPRGSKASTCAASSASPWSATPRSCFRHKRHRKHALSAEIERAFGGVSMLWENQRKALRNRALGILATHSRLDFYRRKLH
jgi:hypothetical protein